MIERAYELLDFVGLGSTVADRVATTLSYGHQRRVEIARALMSAPKLLLLDEPLAGMNALEKTEIADLVRAVRDQGITVLLIEHDMQIVRSLCGHLTVLDYGKRLADGTPHAVLSDPWCRPPISAGSGCDGRHQPSPLRRGAQCRAADGGEGPRRRLWPHPRGRRHQPHHRARPHRQPRRQQRRRQDHDPDGALRPACR